MRVVIGAPFGAIGVEVAAAVLLNVVAVATAFGGAYDAVVAKAPLVTISVGFGLFRAKADPHYGKIPLYLMSSLPILIIWLPYWIATAFIDGYKRTGFFMASLLLADFVLFLSLILKDNFGLGIIAYMILAVSIPLFIILAVINFLRNLRKS